MGEAEIDAWGAIARAGDLFGDATSARLLTALAATLGAGVAPDRRVSVGVFGDCLAATLCPTPEPEPRTAAALLMAVEPVAATRSGKGWLMRRKPPVSRSFPAALGEAIAEIIGRDEQALERPVQVRSWADARGECGAVIFDDPFGGRPCRAFYATGRRTLATHSMELTTGGPQMAMVAQPALASSRPPQPRPRLVSRNFGASV